MSASDETMRFGIPATPSGPPPPHGSSPPPPPPRSSGNAVAANLISGILLMIYGAAVAAWVLRGFYDSDTAVGDFVEAVFNSKTPISPQFMTPYEWVFAVVLLVFGVLAAAQTRVGRGGALILGWLLLALSLREAVGALDETYRDGYFNLELGEWVLATRIIGLLMAVAIVVLQLLAGRARTPAAGMPLGDDAPGAAMGKAGDDLPRPGARSDSEPPTRGQVVAHTVGGALLLVYGGVLIAWILRTLDQSGVSIGDYLEHAVDPSQQGGPTQLAAGQSFYEPAIAVTLVILGILALCRRRMTFGAATALLAVQFYLHLRFMISCSVDSGELPFPTWDLYTQDLEGYLYLASVSLGMVCAVAVPILLSVATRPAPPPRSGNAPWQPTSGAPPV